MVRGCLLYNFCSSYPTITQKDLLCVSESSSTTTTEATTVAMSSAEFREWEEPCISPNLKGHSEVRTPLSQNVQPPTLAKIDPDATLSEICSHDSYPSRKMTQMRMETPLVTGTAQAPEEDDCGQVTLVATEQASHAFYTNDVDPMDRPFFGCLQPCNSALRRIDFVKTRPVVRIGRGPNNDINFPGIRISAKSLPPSTLLFFPPSTLCLRVTSFLGLIGLNHCQIKWDGCEDSRSNVTVLDNSTNGTWVWVFYSCIYPTFPLLGPSVATRVRSHTHAHAYIHRSMGCA